MKRMNRREALGIFGVAPLALNPLEVLVGSLVSGLFNKAQAETVGKKDPPARNFVHILQFGGAPRWYFDAPLSPYENKTSVPNQGVATGFQDHGSHLGLPVYSRSKVVRGNHELWLPSLWTSMIPTSGGGSVPMMALLDHILMIQGINLGLDGHPSNANRQNRPDPGSPSFTGLVADRSDTPIPAVQAFGGLAVHKSLKGIGQVSVTSKTYPLGELLSPFKHAALNDGYMNRREAMDAVINKALGRLAQYAQSSVPGSENLFEIRHQAEALMRKPLGNLASAYSMLYLKYHGLIETALGSMGSVRGIGDKEIRTALFPTNEFGVTNFTRISHSTVDSCVKNKDLRTVLQAGKSTIENLAEGMAIAEYMLVNGYSSSVTLGTNVLRGFRYEDRVRFGNGQAVSALDQEGVWESDEHAGGVAVSVVINSFRYRALAACLYEFISVLKAKGIFNDTVIEIGGEFNRSPRNDGSGSDHGWWGTAVSLISGAISGPHIVGNVKSAGVSSGANYGGSWGAAAPVRVDGADTALGLGHVSSTLAALLRVRSPTPNNMSLLTETQEGALVPAVDRAKEVG